MARLITTAVLLMALLVIVACAVVVVCGTCLQALREVWR